MEEISASEKSSLISDIMREGIILGIIHIVVFLILYYFIPSKLTGFSYLAFVIVLNIGFCIFKGLNYRKELGGYVGFGPAFKYSFLILLFNGLLSSLLIPIAFSLLIRTMVMSWLNLKPTLQSIGLKNLGHRRSQ